MRIPLKCAERALESGVSFASEMDMKIKYEKPIDEIFTIRRQLEDRRQFSALPRHIESALRDGKQYAPREAGEVNTALVYLYKSFVAFDEALLRKKKELEEAAKKAGVSIAPHLLKN